MQDVTQQEQVDAAVKTVEAELARRGNLPLVGLVNNAGVCCLLWFWFWFWVVALGLDARRCLIG